MIPKYKVGNKIEFRKSKNVALITETSDGCYRFKYIEIHDVGCVNPNLSMFYDDIERLAIKLSIDTAKVWREVLNEDV